MRSRNKIIGIGATVFLLLVLTVLQLQAQTPTATPENPTATTELVTSTPVPTTATSTLTTTLSKRQAVVKRPIDGDSIEIVFVDDGTIATVHLANVDAPEFSDHIECFGRESSEFVTQTFRDNPLVSVSLTGDVQDGEVFGYVELPDRTLVNRLLVLFGYGKFDDQIKSTFTSDIKDAEELGKRGKAGLWRVCGETEQPPQPCFLFSQNGIDSASKQAFFVEFPDASELRGYFSNVTYSPAQNELVVIWSISIDDTLSGWIMREHYRLWDCSRDRSEVYNPRNNR